jgi:effector-binding domain-containing protein
MIKTERIEQEAIPTLYIRTRTPVEKLPQVIGEGYGKIAAHMTSLGEQPKEIPYVAYYSLDMQDLDIEIGFPQQKALPGGEGIEAGEIQPGIFAQAVYTGAYAGMEPAYNDMFAWMRQNGYEQSGESYEYYFNSPLEVPESELKTKIMIRLKKV